MENSIPVKKLTFKEIKEELTPTFKKRKTEDQVMSELQAYKGWDILKAKIERRIDQIEENTKRTIEDVEDVELYGFKCLAKDLIVEQLNAIIEEVEAPAKFLKNKDGDTK